MSKDKSSRGRMLLRETSDVLHRDGMVELAVVVMTMNEVGDDRADRRRGSADSSKVQQEIVICEHSLLM